LNRNCSSRLTAALMRAPPCGLQDGVFMNLPAFAVAEQPASPSSDLVEITRHACLLAKEAVSHALDGLINGSSAALQAVRRCEEKLDDLDRELDERLAGTITQVAPARARELLACMKLMVDLERVGDLVVSFAERAAIVRNRIDMEDIEQLTRMACLVENMLTQISDAFAARDVDQAIRVLRTDAEIDRFRNLLVVRHTENAEGLRGQESFTRARHGQRLRTRRRPHQEHG
jgi:phosphate uptake regulator